VKHWVLIERFYKLCIPGKGNDVPPSLWLFQDSYDSEKEKGRIGMAELNKRLFVGIKISTKLQSQLDTPAPGTERYFKQDNGEYLQIVTLGEDRVIGRFVKNGFPSGDIVDVSRNVRSIVGLITRGNNMDEDSVHIYVP